METVHERFEQLLEDWNMMQRTVGDEGADWAERFERNFYLFIDELKKWINSLKQKPKTLEEVEALPEINTFLSRIPDPLHLNLLNELEDIIEENSKKWYD